MQRHHGSRLPKLVAAALNDGASLISPPTQPAPHEELGTLRREVLHLRGAIAAVQMQLTKLVDVYDAQHRAEQVGQVHFDEEVEIIDSVEE